MLSEEYRKRAEECVQLAQTAKPHERQWLLQMAQMWLRLSDRKDRDRELIEGDETPENVETTGPEPQA